MKDQELLIAFSSVSITTWMIMILFYFRFLSKKRLIKNGYTYEFISFMRMDYRTRMTAIGIAIPILLLSAIGIFWVLAGRPEKYIHYIYIYGIFLALIFPMAILDYIKTKDAYHTLIYQGSTKNELEMNTNKFFNPILELFIAIPFILYSIILIKLPFMVYFHLAIPWILYFVSTKSRIFTQFILRDGYLYSFIFMELNYLLVIFYIARYGFNCEDCFSNENKLISLLLMAIMFSRMIYYIMNFRKDYQSFSS